MTRVVWEMYQTDRASSGPDSLGQAMQWAAVMANGQERMYRLRPQWFVEAVLDDTSELAAAQKWLDEPNVIGAVRCVYDVPPLDYAWWKISGAWLRFKHLLMTPVRRRKMKRLKTYTVQIPND